MDKEEQRRFFGSMVFPVILVMALWFIKIIEVSFQTSFADFGLLPQSIKGIRGVLFSPLLHSDWKHLSANSVPIFLLSSGLFYYYGKKALTIFILCWLVTGFWVWIFARGTGIHIGASGVVYALATFHFTGGILRKEPRMLAFSLLIVFLYGSLIWGVIPDFYPEKNISWESHLLGGLAGILIAFAFRREGPQKKVYHWDDDDQEIDYMEEDPEIPSEEPTSSKEKSDAENVSVDVKINYHFKD
jgi:membrane associated rhomboid family serine protease